MSERGFTLIEVLVALAIVTVGMGAVLSAMTSAADTTLYLRDKTFAEWVALNRITEVRLQPRMPARGKTDGEAELAGRKWRWEQEVLPLEAKGMLRIDVRVRPQEVKQGTWYTTASGIMGDGVDYGWSPTSDFDLTPQATPPGGGGLQEESGSQEGQEEEQAPHQESEG